jgi:hypothetical protein
MSFIWHFYTGESAATPVGRRCHRGPMIDIELVLSQPFTYMVGYNTLRLRLLGEITETTELAVQTREMLLRVLNSSLGPMMARLTPRKRALQALICEKRKSTEIDRSMEGISSFFAGGANGLYSYKFPQQQIDLLLAALESHSPVLRTAGKCAVVLIAGFFEMDYHNG